MSNEINVGAEARSGKHDVAGGPVSDEEIARTLSALVELHALTERRATVNAEFARARAELDRLKREIEAIRREIKTSPSDPRSVAAAAMRAERLARAITAATEGHQRIFRRLGLGGDENDNAGEPIPVDVYLDTDDEQEALRVFSAVDRLTRLLGYSEPFDESITRGSFLRRAKVSLRHGVDSAEVQSRLVKVERALELNYLDGRQADVDAKTAGAVKQLIDSVKDIRQVTMRVGSLFLVKYEDGGVPVVLVRTLSQLEIRALERYPEIQSVPRQALNSLATATLALEGVAD